MFWAIGLAFLLVGLSDTLAGFADVAATVTLLLLYIALELARSLILWPFAPPRAWPPPALQYCCCLSLDSRCWYQLSLSSPSLLAPRWILLLLSPEGPKDTLSTGMLHIRTQDNTMTLPEQEVYMGMVRVRFPHSVPVFVPTFQLNFAPHTERIVTPVPGPRGPLPRAGGRALGPREPLTRADPIIHVQHNQPGLELTE